MNREESVLEEENVFSVLDVNLDNTISSIDALMVINRLRQGDTSESTQSTDTAFAELGSYIDEESRRKRRSRYLEDVLIS